MFTLQSDSKNQRVIMQIDHITKNIEKGIRKANYFIGKDLVKYTANKMKEEKHGRTYHRGVELNSGRKNKKSQMMVVYGKNKPVTYVASAPGEVPLSKAPGTTGRLRKSLNFLVRGWQQLEFGAETPYAKYLELGTPKMKPRPYLRPAIIDNFRNMETYYQEQIKLALEKDNA